MNNKSLAQISLRVLLFMSMIMVFIMPALVHAQEDDPVVVLSPGHGWLSESGVGIDPGAGRDGLYEKQINLEVAEYTSDFLERCDVEVHLTRNGDDKEHQLTDVDEIVNDLDPDVGVSIHTNSGAATDSGAEGWYTDGGYDDDESKELAGLLSESISNQFDISDLGTQSESDNRHGGLYIHWWDAPSALIEIGYLQGDFELIQNNREDFGRAIAKAILEYLEVPATCADKAVAQDIYASTYFPAGVGSHKIRILNDGVLPWNVGEYELTSVSDPFGAEPSYAMPEKIMPGQVAEWEIPIKALINPGIYRQIWQVRRVEDGGMVEKPVKVYMIVVPQQAKDLKEDIDKKIEELKQQGEEAVEEFIRELQRQAVQWLEREITDIVCPSGYLLIFVGFVFSAKQIRRRN